MSPLSRSRTLASIACLNDFGVGDANGLEKKSNDNDRTCTSESLSGIQ